MAEYSKTRAELSMMYELGQFVWLVICKVHGIHSRFRLTYAEQFIKTLPL